MDISTADLQSSAPTFQHQSEALRQAAQTLRTTLDNLGAPWGGDEQGREFENAYAPNWAAIEQSVGVLVEGLASIHLAMKKMAEGHAGNEALTEGMFKPHDSRGGR
ncbi:WXG100 family type VII secretion target [Streptomyces pathocidini]|uniref:WXG100 family type VII secretion target n=1 Tax=Streptomyces pathocidini TaxID=1650571 RepID=A0ABW7UUE1_9ACTN|nr:WXG100 family type VII secretion target [Streptomyces pathocidini]